MKNAILKCHIVVILISIGIYINFINFKFDSNYLLNIHTVNYTISHHTQNNINNNSSLTTKITQDSNYKINFNFIDIETKIINNQSISPPIDNEKIQRIYFKNNDDGIYKFYKTFLLIYKINIGCCFILIIFSILFNLYLQEFHKFKLYYGNSNNSSSDGNNNNDYNDEGGESRFKYKVIFNFFKISIILLLLPMIGFSMYLIFSPQDINFKMAFRKQCESTPFLNQLCFDANGEYFGICEISNATRSIENQDRLVKFNLNLSDKTIKDKNNNYIIWQVYSVKMCTFHKRSWIIGTLVIVLSICNLCQFALIDRKSRKIKNTSSILVNLNNINNNNNRR